MKVDDLLEILPGAPHQFHLQVSNGCVTVQECHDLVKREPDPKPQELRKAFSSSETIRDSSSGGMRLSGNSSRAASNGFSVPLYISDASLVHLFIHSPTK